MQFKCQPSIGDASLSCADGVELFLHEPPTPKRPWASDYYPNEDSPLASEVWKLICTNFIVPFICFHCLTFFCIAGTTETDNNRHGNRGSFIDSFFISHHYYDAVSGLNSMFINHSIAPNIPNKQVSTNAYSKAGSCYSQWRPAVAEIQTQFLPAVSIALYNRVSPLSHRDHS